ncbi:MAG: alanine racemase [Actinobacteria bacterium]|nr:alanine racemase [Actinomycetota bacterium]
MTEPETGWGLPDLEHPGLREHLDTPTLVVDVATVRRNVIEHVAQLSARGVVLRPARALGAATRGLDRPLEVLVELDSGDRRSGCSPDQACEVAAAARDAGLRMVGVFTHGGHSYAAPEAAAGAAEDEVEVLRRGRDLLLAEGHDIAVVSAGSTPTALASGRDGVTEVRPGTFVYGDRQQVMLGSTGRSDVALAVATTVVSTAVAGQFVLDAGAKALGKDRHPLLPGHGHLPAYPDAVITRVYDHHAVVETGGERPELGQLLLLVPNHVCPVVNLASSTVVVDGSTVEVWPVDARSCNA